MAGAKKKAEGDEMPQFDIDKKTMKKVFYGSNILFIGVGFLILLIMFFVAWDFMDKTEKLVKGVADDTCDTLTAVEATLADAEEEIALLGGTIGGMESSIDALSEGVGDAGAALRGISGAFDPLKTFGVYIGGEIGESAASLENASAELAITSGGLEEHEEKLTEIGNDLGDIRVSVASQKQTICNQKNIIEIFDSMRLTVIILFVLTAVLIFIIFVNSAAGMI